MPLRIRPLRSAALIPQETRQIGNQSSSTQVMNQSTDRACGIVGRLQ